MLLLLASFTVSLLGFLLVESIRRCNNTCEKLKKQLPFVSYADCFLEAVNRDINTHWTLVPVLIKVYLIGVIETIHITFCKRGLFKSSITQAESNKRVEELVRCHVRDEREASPPFAIVTGADSGIGFEISRGLLEAGYQVIIGAHSQISCHDAISKLKVITGSDKISSISLDLSSFKSVKSFVQGVQKKISQNKIELLINNAGVMNVPYRMTEDGFESQIQINFLSPVLLTRLLLPQLNTETGRVLFASSSTMYTINNLDIKMPCSKYTYDGLTHYAYSKACIAQLVPRVAKTTQVKIYSYHPGTVRTKLFSTTAIFNLPLVSKLFDFIMLSPKEGSQTPLHVALTNHAERSGSYWANERVQSLPTILIKEKPENIDALWKDTMAKIGLEE